MVIILKLKRFLKPYLKETIFGSLLKLLEAFLELLLPFFMMKIVDIGIPSNDANYIKSSLLKMFGCTILGLASVIICQKLATVVSCHVATDIRNSLMEKVSDLSYNQIDKIGSSSLVTRLTIDVNLVRDAVAFLIRLVTRAPFLAIGAVVMGFSVDKKITAIFLVIIPVFSIFLFYIMKKIIPYQKKVQKTFDKLTKQLSENLSGARVIRAFVKQDYEKKRVDSTVDELKEYYIKGNGFSNIINPVTTFLLNLVIIFLLFVGGNRVNAGTLQKGEIIALIQYITQIMFALIIISDLVTLFTKASASATRIDEVLSLDKEIIYKEEGEGFSLNENQENIIEFKNVSYAYIVDRDKSGKIRKEKNSLTDISFFVKRGDTLGIIGPTGSGKTTILNLLARFYDITRGEILVDGENVKNYPKNKLLDKISIVPQKSVLFSGSIKENIKFTKNDATDDEVEKALDDAMAKGFVDNLDEGMDSRVERGGINFSGGQRQRMAIARGLIKNAQILVLDDSLSALDFKTDMIIRKNLREKYKDTTIIVVSQRVSSVMSADNILVIENGYIKEQGNHEELMAKNGLYEEIYKTQIEE